MPRSRACPRRPAATPASRCPSATCSRRAARPAPGRSSLDEVVWTIRGRGRQRRSPPRPISPALPLHRLPRPARRVRASPGAARSRRPGPGHDRPGFGRHAGDAPGAVPRRDRRPRAPRRAARPPHAATARRVSARSSSGSRATSGRRRCSPRSGWPCSTPSSRRAAWPPSPAAPARCGSPAGTSARRTPPSGASATRGSRSRTRSAASAGSSSVSTAGRSARSRPASARTSGASGRGPRRPSSGCAGPSGLLALRDDPTGLRPDGRRRRGSASCWASRRCARTSSGWPLMYHGTSWVLGREAAVAAAGRCPRQHVAAPAVELAGRLDRPGARGDRAGDGPRRPGRPAGRWRCRGRRRGRDRRRDRRVTAS